MLHRLHTLQPKLTRIALFITFVFVSATVPVQALDCPNGPCVSLQPSGLSIQETGDINISGTLIAGTLQGNGANITDLNASNLTTGTVADDRLSNNIPRLNVGNTFTAEQTLRAGLVLENQAGQLQNGVSSMVLVRPIAGANGISIKVPNTTWGTAAPYGTEQVFEVIREGGTSVSGPGGGSVVFRIDRFGGLGTGGAMHIATGLGDPNYGVGQAAVWIDPSVNVAVGLAIHNPTVAESASWTGSYVSMIDTRNANREVFKVGTTGDVVIQPTMSSSTPLTLKAASASSIAPLLTIANSNGTRRQTVLADYGTYYWTEDGTTATMALNAGAVGSWGFRAYMNTGSTGTTGLVLRGVSGQTADLFQAQNNVGATLAKIDANGNLMVKVVDVQGNLTVAGNVAFNGSTVTLNNNLRGINQPLASSAALLVVTFATPHPDANYAIQCTPSYNTTCYATDKLATGFTLRFGTTAPSDGSGKVDWLVLR